MAQPSDIDFQPYLNAIATTYEKWWQLYTLTDAEGKQQPSQEVAPLFDLGLMVQTETDGMIEQFSVLEGIRKYANQQVLLVGRPGSGKSTALARLMLEEATTQKSEFLKNALAAVDVVSIVSADGADSGECRTDVSVVYSGVRSQPETGCGD